MSEQTFLTAKIDAEGGPQSVTDQACVPWWSFTKTVLATTALKLAAQGHCRLGERLGGRPYTLRQLLQHRAGVPNYGNFASYHEAVRRGDKPWEIGELLERVGLTALISSRGMAGAIRTPAICSFASSSRMLPTGI
jgi:D-alanyl-D-alanine carboxypeptidase